MLSVLSKVIIYMFSKILVIMPKDLVRVLNYVLKSKGLRLSKKKRRIDYQVSKLNMWQCQI